MNAPIAEEEGLNDNDDDDDTDMNENGEKSRYVKERLQKQKEANVETEIILQALPR